MKTTTTCRAVHYRWTGFRHCLMTLTLAAGILLSGCDTTGANEEENVMDALTSIELIESMEMSPLPAGENEDVQEYVLRVKLKNVEGIKYPEAINLLGTATHTPSSLVFDDGSAFDVVAGDLIFTGVVTESCSEIMIPEGLGAKDIIKITLSCEGDFISPGDECEGHGICPETSQRSFLWGLIEYETNVSVCWCGFSCDYDISIELGL